MTIQFCPMCGHVVTDQERFGRLRRVCPNCEYIHFDDPKVAAVVWLERDQVGQKQVLLVKRGVDPAKGLWALPAGYVDRGEDPRTAAAREALEETGLIVEPEQVIDVFFSGGPTISIVFCAKVVGGTLAPGDDAEDACWFGADALPELAFESTQQLIARWHTKGSV